MSEYKKIVELVNPKNGFYLDSYDLSKILFKLDDIIFPEKEYDLLLEDIGLMMNALACEYGRDYGSEVNWDEEVLEMTDNFKNYTSDDLVVLIEFLKDKFDKKIRV